ncbi:MAG: hypothetical protein ACFWUL_11190 [Dialister sp.]|jgi:hypothetical protein
MDSVTLLETSDGQTSDARLLMPLRGYPSPGLWPSPFGLKGRRLNGQAKRLIYAKLECPMQDIHLQGGTLLMDSVTLLEAPDGQTSDIRLLKPLRGYPSPGLWPSPFSKGERF